MMSRTNFALAIAMLCTVGCDGKPSAQQQPPVDLGADQASSVTNGQFAYPLGIYDDSGVTASPNPLNDAAIKGGLVRVQWNQIETSAGNFSWSNLDKQVDTIECNANCYSGMSAGTCSNNLDASGRGTSCVPRKWSLSVLGGPFSPTWLFSNPYNVGTFTLNGTMTIPKFWDTTLLQRLDSLASALAKRYGNDQYLQLVYIPQMTQNGVEGAFYGPFDQTLTNAGYTVDNWVSAVEQTTLSFATAFPTKSVAAELHYLLSNSCAGLRIMNDLALSANGYAAKPLAYQQIGVAIWWLDGATNYQGDMLLGTSFGDTQDKIGTTCPAAISGGFQGFVKAGGRVYAQLIQQSSMTASFPTGFAGVFTQAQQLGIKYIEVWQQDVTLTGSPWETNFSNFNTYAGAQ